MVTEWIDSFPTTAHIADIMDHIYPGTSVDDSSGDGVGERNSHKEEGEKRIALDSDDRNRISQELSRLSHPLEDKSPHLYNIVNGAFAPPEAGVNVMEAAVIGERLAAGFRASLPTGFHSTISTPLKTMQHLKKGMKLGDRTVFDLETVFLRLLRIGQQRQLELADIFKYELCLVPCSLIDEYGCLRRGSKSPLAHKLCVQTQNREVPELVIIDASQLLYHIVWPFRGHVSDIVESIKRRLSPVPGEKILVFDKYHDLSAKDHERVRRAGIGSTKYNLTVNTQLPNREAIMRNKHSKLVLSHVMSTYSFGGNVTVESHSDGIFKHDEADITMISHFLLAADSGTKCIRILSDDTDVFVLLIYWVYRHSINATVQMERWDGSVWDINATCAQLNSAPSACRFWECITSLAQIPLHICMERGKCQPSRL